MKITLTINVERNGNVPVMKARVGEEMPTTYVINAEEYDEPMSIEEATNEFRKLLKNCTRP